ncbi:hypothetical protein [Thalassobacillus sp. CUG 92003]|uniref:hypothetical protein n=1 Tax=Thalassobacillus sp. CUG 92003 TaxID=2736641 RepID=UPI0015E6E575|nr:hypothetical protein [Thalassobacillus sp. CUG 92003]
MEAYSFRQYIYDDCKFDLKDVIVSEECFQRTGFGKYVFNVNMDGFLVAPGKVMLDVKRPLFASSSRVKDAEDYMARGCTLLLVQWPMTASGSFRKTFHTFKQSLRHLPVDHMIVPKVPIQLLTSDMVRFLGRQACPFIMIEVEEEHFLHAKAWEWLEEGQSFRRIPFTVSSPALWSKWQEMCQYYGMIHLVDPIEDELTLENLKVSGIYPYKGRLIPNGYADYNLYWLGEGSPIDGEINFRYHDAVPNVTVMRGKITQVNQSVLASDPGKSMNVAIPKHFV